MQRLSLSERRFRARVAGVSGGIDLASLMVGVTALGVLASIAVASVFAVIPWTQDHVAAQSLTSVSTAQSIALARYGTYLDGADLAANGLIPSASAQAPISGGRGADVSPRFVAATPPVGVPQITVNADGSCYVSAVLSRTGAVYWDSSESPTPKRVVPGVNTEPDTSSCAPFPNVAAWPAPLAITTVNLPTGVVGQPYTAEVQWTGTVAPTFTVTDGHTPAGVTLTASGVLTGTPSSGGTSTFTVTGTSTNGDASATYTVAVGTPPSLPTTTSLPPATTSAPYTATIAAGGDPSTYTVTAGALPTGVTLSPAGVVSGTPSAVGTSTFTVTATNSSGSAQTVVTISTARGFIVLGSTVAEGKDVAYALDTGGNATAWGVPSSGELGKAGAKSAPTPTLLTAPSAFASITAGDNFAIALDHSGHLYGWGDNSFDELGTTGNGPTVPTLIPSVPIFQMVTAGFNHTLGIDDAGHLWGWGDNSYYETGTTSSKASVLPTKIPSVQNQTFTWVTAGHLVSAAIDSNGHLWTFGSSNSGVLGNGSKTNSVATAPQEIAPTQTFVKVTVGGDNNSWMTAIDTSGHLWAWGLNNGGQLGVGNNTTSAYYVPTAVPSNATFSSIAIAGSGATFAVDTAGNLYVSGTAPAALGQKGSYAMTPFTPPTAIGGAVTDIASYKDDVFVKTTGDQYYAWGFNGSPTNGDWYLVGDGTTTDRWTPTQISVP